MGDFNIDVKKPECLGYDEVERFSDTFKSDLRPYVLDQSTQWIMNGLLF